MKKISLMLSLSLFLTFSVIVLGQDVKMIDPPLQFTIDSHPDSGFFTRIHSVSIDENNQVVYVLHNTPAVLSKYSLSFGNSLDQVSFVDRLEEPLSMAACGDNIWILERRRVKLLWSGGILKEPWLEIDGMPYYADKGVCFFNGDLITADYMMSILAEITPDWKEHIFYGDRKSAENNDRQKNELIFISDVTSGNYDSIYILNSKNSVVWQMDNAGRIIRSTSLFPPEESFTPADYTSIAVDSSSNIWALNTADNSIDVFDSFGDAIYRFPNTGESGFRFISPESIEIDEHDMLFILDAGDMSVKVFDVSNIY